MSRARELAEDLRAQLVPGRFTTSELGAITSAIAFLDSLADRSESPGGEEAKVAKLREFAEGTLDACLGDNIHAILDELDRRGERIAELAHLEKRDAPCHFCGKPCNPWAANPGLWPIPLCHADEPGVVKLHHIGCVEERLRTGGRNKAELARLHDVLTKISAIRDSIVGAQQFNWSEHAYPLVAALKEAGYEGVGYEIARKNLGTLLEQINGAEARIAAALAVLDGWENDPRESLSEAIREALTKP